MNSRECLLKFFSFQGKSLRRFHVLSTGHSSPAVLTVRGDPLPYEPRGAMKDLKRGASSLPRTASGAVSANPSRTLSPSQPVRVSDRNGSTPPDFLRWKFVPSRFFRVPPHEVRVRDEQKLPAAKDRVSVGPGLAMSRTSRPGAGSSACPRKKPEERDGARAEVRRARGPAERSHGWVTLRANPSDGGRSSGHGACPSREKRIREKPPQDLGRPGPMTPETPARPGGSGASRPSGCGSSAPQGVLP